MRSLESVIESFSNPFSDNITEIDRDEAIHTLATEVKKLKERVFLDELKADNEKAVVPENNKVKFKRGDRVGRNGKDWQKEVSGEPYRGQVITISKGRVRVQWDDNKVSWIKPSNLMKIA